MSRSFRLLATLLLLVCASAARATVLADSTVTDAWRLDNGLEVRTRHLPGAAGVSVTLAVRAGAGYEAAGSEGLSELLAELAFTSGAGKLPERSRAEMASLRPLGWESRQGTRLVRFTEIATQAQLPGVLQQIATRLSGVTLTEAGVKAALANVHSAARARLLGEPVDVLYWRSSALARGLTEQQITRSANLPALDRIGVRDLAKQLQRWYHAGNASLALAGDLSGIDTHALIKSLFAPLPGGPAMPDTVQLRLSGSSRATPWKGLSAPVGVIAVSAPALTDSLHPSFFMAMLITGSGVMRSWGPAAPPLVSHFQYSLMDQPELVTFYPPMPANATDPDVVAGGLYEQLQIVGAFVTADESLARMRKSVRWLLGGELPPELQLRMHSEPGGLGTLSSGMATRALWMGDGFWADYLFRFDTQKVAHTSFYGDIADPSHQTVLLLTPAP